MNPILQKIWKSLIGLLYLVISLFFFYVDNFIFQNVIWPSWQHGSLQLQEKLSIFIFNFNDNMAYLPFLIYLAVGLFFLVAFIRIYYRIWFRRG